MPTPRLEYLPDRPRTRGTVPEEVEVSYFDLYNGQTFNVRKKRWIDCNEFTFALTSARTIAIYFHFLLSKP